MLSDFSNEKSSSSLTLGHINQTEYAISSIGAAEQHALKAKRDLDRIKIEAEQKVTAATAEAEALRLQKMNISADLIELRKIEANLKAIEKWNGILPQVTGGGAVPFIGVSDLQKKQ